MPLYDFTWRKPSPWTLADFQVLSSPANPYQIHGHQSSYSSTYPKSLNSLKITVKSRPTQNRLFNRLQAWNLWQTLSSHIPQVNTAFHWIRTRLFALLFWMLLWSSFRYSLQVLVAVNIIEHFQSVDLFLILFKVVQLIAQYRQCAIKSIHFLDRISPHLKLNMLIVFFLFALWEHSHKMLNKLGELRLLILWVIKRLLYVFKV